MPRFNHIKNSFRTGELSPKLFGRTDLPEYLQGCETLENMVVFPTGGATKRPGSRFIAKADQLIAGAPCWARLLPFIYSRTEAYSVSLSNSTTDQGPYILRNDGTRATLTDYSTFPWNSLSVTDLNELQFVQSADILYIVHASYKPIRIRRLAALTFEIRDFDDVNGYPANSVILRYPFLDMNLTSTTLAPSATSGAITITASGGSPFTSGHVGSYFKITQGATTGVAKVTGFTDSQHVSATVLIAFANLTAVTSWEESAWSTARGWPRAVVFFEGRLCYGGNANRPDTIWGSKIASYDQLMSRRLQQDTGTTDSSGLGYFGSPTASDPISLTIASSEINQLQWLSGLSDFVFGTLGTEYVDRGSQGSALSATEVPAFRPLSSLGSKYLQAKRVGNDLVYVSRDGLRLRAIVRDDNYELYKSEDLSKLADHILKAGMVGSSFGAEFSQLAYQASRGVLWCVSSGVSTQQSLLGITVDKESGTVAWHRHKLGGSFGFDASVPPYITGMCVIPSPTGKYDELWLNVIRYNHNSNSNQYYLEKIANDFEIDDISDTSTAADDKPWFSDCAVFVHNASAQTVIAGFSHIKGEQVAVLGDGLYQGLVTVDSSGNITIPTAAKQVIAGIPYYPTLTTTKIDAGSAIGSAVGAVMRVDRATLRFYRTGSCRVQAYGSSNYEDINFRDPTTPMNLPTPLFTGDKIVDISMSPERAAQITLTQHEPLPLTITAVVLRGDTRDQ